MPNIDPDKLDVSDRQPEYHEVKACYERRIKFLGPYVQLYEAARDIGHKGNETDCAFCVAVKKIDDQLKENEKSLIDKAVGFYPMDGAYVFGEKTERSIKSIFRRKPK